MWKVNSAIITVKSIIFMCEKEIIVLFKEEIFTAKKLQLSLATMAGS